MSATQSLVPETVGQDINLPTAVDLSAAQYKFVYMVAGLIVLATTGVRALGILQNKPVGTSAKHAAAQVRMFGFSKYLSGGSISSGNGIMPNTTSAGDGIAATTDHNLQAAMAIGDSVSGDIAACVLTPGGAVSL